MKPEDYPEQEPVSDFAKEYHATLIERAAKLPGEEIFFGDDPYQSLVYYPAEKPDSDVFVMIHGGGWVSGYKEYMAFMAPEFVKRGFAFASLGYRLAPKYIYPDGLEDCMRGFCRVFEHIDKLNGNTERMFLSGHSAGGHYASLLAVRRDWQEHFGLPENIVHGCLPVSGVYDFTEGSGLSMMPRFLGSIGNAVDASPVLNIMGTPPPFFISYGSNDFPHLKTQADHMADELKKAGTDVTTLELAGCDHLGASLSNGDPDGPWLDAAIDWIGKH